MAAHVGNHLGRRVGPGSLAVVHLAHVNLRMRDAAGDAELDALFISGDGTEESRLMVVAERTAQCVAHVITEGTDAVELAGVGLHGEFLVGIGTCTGTPSFTIHIYRGVDFVQRFANHVHGLDVVDAHQVEAESVDVIFLGPVEHRLNHELAHEWFLAGSLVAAA